MTWRGFYKESKSFMVYDSLSFIEKVKFWLWYPFAYIGYIWIMTFDNSIKQKMKDVKEWESNNEDIS